MTTGTTKRLKLAIRGAVQGVGFRPFVLRLANDLALAGWVCNSPQGVFIEVEGPRGALDDFLQRLERERPPLSFIQSLDTSWLDPVGHKGFQIRPSDTTGKRSALVLPDISTCSDCLREIHDPANRRYHYPFTNCTHCGPRFSIIESLPYDRSNTSMKSFQMCPACRAEYNDPSNRRFHAQPNACPQCGPQLTFLDPNAARSYRYDAVLAAARQLRQGNIAAVKGIGGFHLMVDARNEEAIQRLRQRKHREEKPFALLFPTLESVAQVCEVSPQEERLLRSPESPIVLLQRQTNAAPPLSDAVAPGNPNLGVMLPSNPLHHLLMTELGFPLVATSGNLSDEPICIDENEALGRLREIADVFLIHNRPIVRHVDDSIVRVMLDRETVLRRARGYAPLPITLSDYNLHPTGDGAEIPAVLAVGAHLKNSVALGLGPEVFVSQHIGDLETEQANAAFRSVATDLPRFYDAQPEIIVADLHPDYISTQFAKTTAETAALSSGSRLERRYLGVQHHIAHVLSCMAENDLKPPVLGVAWDGTGYGTDGTIWGSEFFFVGKEDINRIAHLRPFRLPGGEAAVKEPRRVALGISHELLGKDLCQYDCRILDAFSAAELQTVMTMLAHGLNSPVCCSMGRLFDAVASFAGLRQKMRFEGQAAMELEFALKGIVTDESYELGLLQSEMTLQLDWRPMIEAIVGDVKREIPIGLISARFHNALTEAIVKIARRIACPQVALSGGCFQNRYLTERTVTRLRAEGFRPYWHQRVPPNDGGIALGQIYAAYRELNSVLKQADSMLPTMNHTVPQPPEYAH